MCGIAGWLDRDRDLSKQQPVMEKMADTLTPRGPDASGIWISTHVALAHRRLVVVDPAGGSQPMTRYRGDKSYVLVYNGELYNTPDLRQELISRGYTFQGHSDTEVLLISYIEWGEKCVERFNGIFAFAIWDVENQSLFLARDRVGVKPLFYATRGTSFIFGSEIKTLLAHPLISPELDQEGLAEILVLGPGRTPGHGVLRGISELKPGYKMVCKDSGTHISPYWTLESKPHEDDLNTTINKVRDLFYDTIQRQLVADVPVCTLLSGGLDSSAITAVAAKEFKKSQKEPVHTFSIDYTDNDFHFQPNEFQPNSDAPWVEKVSQFLQTQHHYLNIDTPQLVDSLIPAVLARDLPGMADIDSSLYLFSVEIKKHATVGLSGECADEVFGGYPWFYQEDVINATTFPWSRRLEERTKLLNPGLLNLIKPEAYMKERYQEALREVPKLPGENAKETRMRELLYLNLTRWMPTLLDRKDRMSMATGLEVRVPFCDHRLVEYVWNVPWEMKSYNNREKGLLRQALTGMLPHDVLWRRKSPYPKTHNPAYLSAVRDWMLRILDDKTSPLHQLINTTTLRHLTQTATPNINLPWFGQLMNLPQLFAYFIQLDFWLREYKINILI